MKNVTISMDEDLLRWTRIEAAKADTSVSAYIAGRLEESRVARQTYERAMESFLARDPHPLGTQGRLPRREELYKDRLSQISRRHPGPR